MRIKRILAPTDFSKTSLQAVDYAAQLAAEFGAELTLLYVEDTTYALAEEIPSVAQATEIMDQAHRAAKHQIERLCKGLGKSGCKVRSMVVRGPAAEGISKTAAKSHADWIIMGTHGRTGAAHTFLGSVAEQVLQKVSCPVLIVRSQGAPARTSRRSP